LSADYPHNARQALPRPRQTLARPSETFSGVGLHSGEQASLRFLPAAPGAGRSFIVMPSGQEIQASAANVCDTSRCTQLRAGGVTVQTVEHVLAALAGLGVDDAVIELEGGEPPTADGSAAPFAAMIREAGIRAQDGAACADAIRLRRPCVVSDGSGASIAVLPADHYSATVVLDYPNHAYIGTQAVAFDFDSGDFEKEIAPARTYGFVSELTALRAAGLALGASRENAVALGDDGYDSDMRFPDELARHKLLDLVGDLALAGAPILGRVIAIKPGHALNTRLARLISAQL
jgi:UDP-3-O-[3-hydroxymyristoyl] N-acetylglucosamine deacetylase